MAELGNSPFSHSSQAIVVLPGPVSIPTSPQQPVQPWHGLRTRSNQEKLALTSLMHRGIESYLPVCRVRRHRSDRIVTLERPLFPGYVFSRFDPNYCLPIVTTPGVVSIISFGGRPAPIPDDQITAIRAILESGTGSEPDSFTQAGTRIRVTCGPLKSLEGVLIKRQSAWRLLVSIDLLQRAVSVEVDLANVQALT